ncbi:MAG: hypothetical protein IKM87_00780 [Clostridia bacterium]|nr:hypothetical protein [Clostridia bacterium]
MDYLILLIPFILFGLVADTEWGIIIMGVIISAVCFGLIIHTNIKNKPIKAEIERLKKEADRIRNLPRGNKDSVERAKELSEWIKITMQINELEYELKKIK